MQKPLQPTQRINMVKSLAASYTYAFKLYIESPSILRNGVSNNLF
jgi:hypothetical protein